MCSCSIIDHWWPMGKIFHWLLMAVMVGLVSTQHNKVGLGLGTWQERCTC